jgi:hypothetical protein
MLSETLSGFRPERRYHLVTEDAINVKCRSSGKEYAFPYRVHMGKGRPCVALVMPDGDAQVSWQLTAVAKAVIKSVTPHFWRYGLIFFYASADGKGRYKLHQADCRFAGRPGRHYFDGHIDAYPATWTEYHALVGEE